MAQTKEREVTSKTASTPNGKVPLARSSGTATNGNSNGKVTRVVATTSGKTAASAPQSSSPLGGFRGIMQRIGLAPRSSSERPSQTGRFILGMLLFVVGSQVAAYLLLWLDNQFGLGMNNIVILPSNVPLIGGMTLFLLLYLLVIIAIWVALYRFNIIPKDPFGAKARAEAQRRQNGSGARNNNSGKSRPESRTATVKVRPEPRTVAALSHGDVASDEAYERVKAAQRQRRRRASKR